MKPLISLKNVGLRYKRSGNVFRKRSYFNALRSVSLDIYPGETIGVLGKNGAGKTTLLQLIGGILLPNSGKIINHGASVSLLALQAGFDPNLSGRDNAILGGILRGYTKRYVQEHLDEIHEYSELEDFFFEPVRTYSTGMKARLGFSITTIIRPDVLLIDEVLAVGDQHFKQKAEQTMVNLLQSQQTIVLVSHSHQQIVRLCDKAIMISDGISCAAGDPQKILAVYEEEASRNTQAGVN